MNKKIADVGRVVMSCRKSNIALFIQINSERIPAFYHNPSSDIEFPSLNQKRSFYVLLNYPSLWARPAGEGIRLTMKICVCNDIMETIKNLNVSSST